jgi:Kef-type K+ transport system membrane component KefB
LEVELTNLLVIVAAGFCAPLVLGLAPGLRLPAVVLEIVLGIVLGPSVLGWVEIDAPVQTLALLGLAFLLFLAGLEISLKSLRGVAVTSFVMTLAIALGCGFALEAAGLADDAVFVAVVLSATSLGVVLAVLKDAGELGSRIGQTVIAASSVADFAAIVLLTLLFSREASGTGEKLLLLGSFVVLVVVAGLAVVGAERSARVSMALVRLQDTTAQIRVRGAVVLLVALAALASSLGLELILGAFAAGAVMTVVDRDEMATHPLLRTKLEAIGFGFLIPVFFVSSGVRFDLDALTSSSMGLASVPVFLLALLAARGLPAVLYRSLEPVRPRLVAGALLQATSLPFIVTATQIGLELHVVDAAGAAGLVAAGLVSVLVFPLIATSLLARSETKSA